MKHLTLLLTLSLLLANISPSRGDWFYDFDDGTIPDTFVTEGIDSSFTLSSDTLQSDASVRVLSMWDANAPANGGTKIALGFDEEVFDGNVRLSAEINCTESSDNWFGLQVRANAPYGTQPKYFARIILDPQHPNGGRLYVGKDLSSTETEVVGSSWRASDFRRSYFVELDVTDDPVTGFPEISGQLFDHEGGELLATASMIDSNVGGIPPIASGRAVVSLWTTDNDAIYGEFDNIRAVGEQPLLGDVNLDGEVNGLDVDPFVEVLLSGTDDNVTRLMADMNSDGEVNGLDVDPFVAAVVGDEAAAVPEPSSLLLALVALLAFVALGVVGGWRKCRE